ncbi:hypothetical protein SUDANB120_03621 [Streptomyces sp. enrichment culture]
MRDTCSDLMRLPPTTAASRRNTGVCSHLAHLAHLTRCCGADGRQPPSRGGPRSDLGRFCLRMMLWASFRAVRAGRVSADGAADAGRAGHGGRGGREGSLMTPHAPRSLQAIPLGASRQLVGIPGRVVLSRVARKGHRAATRPQGAPFTGRPAPEGQWAAGTPPEHTDPESSAPVFAVSVVALSVVPHRLLLGLRLPGSSPTPPAWPPFSPFPSSPCRWCLIGFCRGRAPRSSPTPPAWPPPSPASAGRLRRGLSAPATPAPVRPRPRVLGSRLPPTPESSQIPPPCRPLGVLSVLGRKARRMVWWKCRGGGESSWNT